LTLITRCSNCGTAFRVQPGQLAARGGKVRCGKCTQIFDGVSGLVEQDGAAADSEPSPQLALFEAARRAAATPLASGPTSVSGEPELLPAFLEEVAPPPRRRLLWALAVLVTLVLLADFGLRKLRSRFVDEASARIDVELSARLMERVLGMRMENKPESVGSFASNLRGFEQVHARRPGDRFTHFVVGEMKRRRVVGT